eukprot:SAG22_NODE_5581_length_990_cov_1.428732_1_plen_60_part_01
MGRGDWVSAAPAWVPVGPAPRRHRTALSLLLSGCLRPACRNLMKCAAARLDYAGTLAAAA